MKFKELIRRILYMITLVLLFTTAYYINNIILRIALVFIEAIMANLIIELIYHMIFKSSDLFMLLSESDKGRMKSNLLQIIFTPIFQTIFVIILSLFVHN